MLWMLFHRSRIAANGPEAPNRELRKPDYWADWDLIRLTHSAIAWGRDSSERLAYAFDCQHFF
jgi:hypothetical protein